MKKYTFEINGKEVTELEAKMAGHYTMVEYTMGNEGWQYNCHYCF